MNNEFPVMFDKKYTLYIKHKELKDYGFSVATDNKKEIDNQINYIKALGNIDYKLTVKK